MCYRPANSNKNLTNLDNLPSSFENLLNTIFEQIKYV